MKCPSKICEQEIPDDSCFCDQCGIHLLRCDKCGSICIGKFCKNCGGSLSAIQPPTAQPSSKPANETPAVPSTSTPSASAASVSVIPTPAPSPTVPSSSETVIVTLPAEKIYLCHLDGWNMEIANGNILGRTNGPHSAALGRFPVISSNHAKVTRTNNEWFITDLNSTNKTYVNGAKLEPNIPVKIKQNDVVMLANITFTVRLA
jgi:hypothetical protein